MHTTLSNQFIGDHLGLMFYSSNLSLQRKLSILNNIGLFILCVLLNFAYREQNKDSMREQMLKIRSLAMAKEHILAIPHLEHLYP